MVSTPPPTPGTKQTMRSRMPLFLILALSLAPVIFALLAYYVPALGLRPQEATNYGALVEPQRPMPDIQALPLTTLEGKPFDLESLKGKWLLISADEGACPESCVKKLFILRNSHASQGKNVKRLARAWFITDNAPVTAQLLESYKGTHMLRADPAKLAAWLAPQATAAEREAALKAPMWIVDPLGNLMLEFPADADPISVRNDISKLIRISSIG